MKLYALHEGVYEGLQKRIDIIKEACIEKEVEFICINSLTFDYTYIPKLTKEDFLFNCTFLDMV